MIFLLTLFSFMHPLIGGLYCLVFVFHPHFYLLSKSCIGLVSICLRGLDERFRKRFVKEEEK